MAFVTQQLADGTYRITDTRTGNAVFQINANSSAVNLASQSVSNTIARTNTTAKNLFVLPANAIPVSLSVTAETGSDAGTTATISIGKTGTNDHFVDAADATADGDLALTTTNLGATVGASAIQVNGIYAETGDASTEGGPWTVTMQFFV